MPANTSPLTAVVTTYDHQAYIEQCLDSVIAQTAPAAQILIIDDASSDDTASVIERWLAVNGRADAFIAHDRNVGLCATLNEALDLATQPYFVQISGDDWQEPGRFASQVAALEDSEPSVAVMVGDIREVDSGGSTIVDHDFSKRVSGAAGVESQPGLLSRLLAENVIPAPGAMIRTAAIREVGGYDATLAFEDYDLWLRLAPDHAMDYRPGIVADYRVHQQSMTRSTARRVALLITEADALAKHIGSSSSGDETIHRRILAIASDILTIGDANAIRRVLTQAHAARPSIATTQEALQLARRRNLKGLQVHRQRLGMPVGRA